MKNPPPPEETPHPPVGYANLGISDKGSYRFGGQHYSFMDFGLWVSVRLGRSSRRIASASINGTSPADYRTTISVEDRLPESALRSMGSAAFVGQVRGYLHTSPHHPSFWEARFEVNLDSTAMDIDFTMPSVRVGEGGDITWRGVPIEKTVDWDFQQDEDGEYIRGVFTGEYGILGSFSKKRVTGVFAGVPE